LTYFSPSSSLEELPEGKMASKESKQRTSVGPILFTSTRSAATSGEGVKSLRSQRSRGMKWD
jgi:hypothetical protein